MPIRFRCPRRDCHPDLCPAKKIYSCLGAAQDLALSRERLARRYDAHQTVIHHDTPALAVLSIHSGQVKLTRSAKSGHETVVGTRGPGALLGVREVLSRRPYQLTAQTLEPSVVCAVPREAFLAAVRDCPELAMRLLGQLSKDYLLTEEQLVTRMHLSVPARTARLLLGLANGSAGSGGAGISMSREEMAHLIGTTRESLSRALHGLAEKRMVELRNGAVVIADPGALEALAD